MSDKRSYRYGVLKKTIVVIIVCWLFLVAASFVWTLFNAVQDQKNLAFQTARSFFSFVLLTREWNSDHGGVYVPVTEWTKPNPYLEDPKRDIAIYHEMTVTKVNPAFMTRQLSEKAAQKMGVQFRITSLNPIRPLNAPGEWEKKALTSFESGLREVGEFTMMGSEKSFRYMAPLVTQKTCLGCHSKQGYREGDIRGGISVYIPFTANIPVVPLSLGHFGVGVFGVFVIGFLGRRLNGAMTKLREQAILDALTGIPNRRFFVEKVFQEFQRSRRENAPLSIVICDIDYFKGYNDTYGHRAGDECLQGVARVIRNSLNRPTDFCARYGGEEFVIVLPNTPLKGACTVAERIRVNVETAGILHGASPVYRVVTISLGVAVYGSEETYEELVNRADEALYRAKENGRNRVEISRRGD